MAGNRTPTQSWCAQHPPMPEQNQPKSRVTWHYILAPDARRPQSYQYLAPSAQAPTVEDQFDIDPDRGRAFGLELAVAEGRCYSDYRAPFAGEAKRPDGVEAVSIATPNNTHYEIAKAALENGLHVVSEKPLCFTVAEAEDLRRLAEARRKIVGVTYGYAGHQMIEQARAMVAKGGLGDIRLVNLQFAHGFHSAPVEERNPSTKWRVDPKFAGPSYVL